MDPMQASVEKKSFGPIIGIVVIIAVLVVGAFYVWGGKLSDSSQAPLTPTDEVSDIQTDLSGGTNVNIDLSDIEKSLK